MKVNKLLDQLNEQSLYEMSNVLQKYTGLPVIIWISPKMGKHGPRIKVQNQYGGKTIADSKFWFSITIEDTPRIIGETGKVKSKDLDLLKKFVSLNKSIFLDYWNLKEQDPFEVIKKIKKVD